MAKIYRNIEQRTDAWKEVKLGKISGTKVAALLGSETTKESAIYELIGERLSAETDSNESDMDRGNRLEPEARAYYEKVTGEKVIEVGFIERDDCKWIGFSPDGLIERDGLVKKCIEIKCLSEKEHIRAIEGGEIPKKYRKQSVQPFVVIDELEELDFVLYNPSLTKIPYYVFTLKRQDILKEVEESLSSQRQIINQVEEIVQKYI